MKRKELPCEMSLELYFHYSSNRDVSSRIQSFYNPSKETGENFESSLQIVMIYRVSRNMRIAKAVKLFIN